MGEQNNTNNDTQTKQNGDTLPKNRVKENTKHIPASRGEEMQDFFNKAFSFSIKQVLKPMHEHISQTDARLHQGEIRAAGLQNAVEQIQHSQQDMEDTSKDICQRLVDFNDTYLHRHQELKGNLEDSIGNVLGFMRAAESKQHEREQHQIDRDRIMMFAIKNPKTQEPNEIAVSESSMGEDKGRELALQEGQKIAGMGSLAGFLRTKKRKTFWYIN